MLLSREKNENNLRVIIKKIQQTTKMSGAKNFKKRYWCLLFPCILFFCLIFFQHFVFKFFPPFPKTRKTLMCRTLGRFKNLLKVFLQRICVQFYFSQLFLGGLTSSKFIWDLKFTSSPHREGSVFIRSNF